MARSRRKAGARKGSAMLDPQASPVAGALAWLCFLGLLGVAVVAIPVAAAIVRRGLPAGARRRVTVEPIAFGHSPRAQRSPRQPVRMHRTLLATAFLALPALVLLLGVGTLRREGIDALEGALALVLPSLLVTLHARRRSTTP
jgi:hypothetical protein